ncbi:MAG: radical SAM protein [Negativicutes bacterium]|nr:radical SAM protein [Negativicutes bacterium]
MEKVIEFIYPVKTQAISITGSECNLDCAHCGGNYLKHMKPLSVLTEGSGAGTNSFLISGGCTVEGKVPVAGQFDTLRKFKQGRRYNLHVGLVDEAEIGMIAAIADKVSFDFVGDNDTISAVFGLNRTVENYAACYQKLRERCRVVPHICIGLFGGEIRGEYRAMEMLQQLGTDQLTFIIFTPTRGTRYADRQPPSLPLVAELLTEARRMFPLTPVNLGCMRPGGRYRSEIDQLAVRLGLNAIVNPAPVAVRLAEELGLTIRRREECCSL